MSRPDSLEAYRRKRDPERTPEPFGGRPAAGPPRFTVQLHWARRLHYDLRLEMDGVLKSWAVPNGPSVRPEEKRLAVHVEDHPVEYADFEGVIPAGNYGAGSVIVWDHGWYRIVKEGDPLDHLARGKLELELFGYKLRGRWTLVRMSKSQKDWLLLKKADAAAADDEATERYPRSVISGLTVEEIRDIPARQAVIRHHVEGLGAKKGDVDASAQPLMLAALEKTPFSGPDWLFEVKYDGVRVIAARRGGAVALYARSGQMVTGRYSEIVAGLRALPMEHFVIDGEIVALDDTGKPSFQRLQARMGLTKPADVQQAMARVPATGIFFDCLALDGYDLRRLPLMERKACLEMLVPPLGRIHYGDHVLEHGEAFFEAASEQRLEGIVAKRLRSAYAGGRSRDWIKLKCQRRQEFVIGGYTDPQGARGFFGALHIGVYDGPSLIYVSKVGTGFDEAMLKRVWDRLQPLLRETSPFDRGGPAGRSPAGGGHHWVEPKLVCEVRYTEWTDDGGIRHPTFMGLRDDKRPEDCRRESVTLAPIVPEALAAPPVAAAPVERPRVRITNPDKVFWPAEGYTKGDLIAFYDAVAPLLLPYLADRPLVLTRYPDGIDGKSFFQKDAPDFVPGWVRTERIYSKDAEREINYFAVDDADMLRYVINLGTIPLHIWASRLHQQDRPDWLVLDLDPKGAPFSDVVKVARELHRLLAEIRLPSYVKTSGATGLHILIPLGAAYTYEDARTFARLLAMLALEGAPDVATLSRPIQSRAGKVYVDYVQNGHGRTIVSPFSVRPVPGASVSCPLRWDEVTPDLDPAAFTIKTLPARFKKMRDPLRPVLKQTIDMMAAIARIEERLSHGKTPAKRPGRA